MTQTVEIEVRTPREGSKLIQCLWRHRLAAGFAQSGAGRLRVAVRSPREDPRLLLDLHDALESWCPGRGSSLTLGESSPLGTF